MTERGMRRFWKAVEVAKEADGWSVTLDGRPLRTPAKAPFLVPTEALARRVAAEWAAQGERVDPASMPFTRSANSAIDRVAPAHAEVASIVAAYAETDLLCYRATHPAELARRQAEAWDPLLDWAASALGTPLKATVGIVPVAQPSASLAALAEEVRRHDPFALAALHDLVALSGSLILGLAVAKGRLSPDRAWELSRLDEDWQEAQWGTDEDAAAVAAARRRDFLHAAAFLSLLGENGAPAAA